MQNHQNFSTCKRDALISKIDGEYFDMLIFGGGITGAGIALDAASRGLKVVLVEKSDFASGTSSRSTKLIHGGLRYLKQMQLRFVSQLGRERRIIRENAQNNVLPTPMLLPIYKGGELNKILTGIALFIYDLIAGVRKEYKVKWVSYKELVERYSFINVEGLKGAFLYYEFKTNDGRLVIETLKKSAEMGVVCLNYAEPVRLISNDGLVQGASVIDHKSNNEFLINAGIVINATGIWCSELLQKFNYNLPKELYPTLGSHLTFEKSDIPIKEAFYLDAPDKRMIFIIPRQNHVYVGTTESYFSADFDEPVVSDEDASYLINALNAKLQLNLTKKHVVSCWAGIRPLLKDNANKAGEISRRDELFLSENGLLTITGGKLTGYRLMAKGVVDNSLVFLNKEHVNCKTESIRISGSEWPNLMTTNKLVEQADHAYDEAKQTKITSADFKQLFYRYGLNTKHITEKAFEYLNSGADSEDVWLKAELWYGVNFEMVSSIVDFFIYRTEMVLFSPKKVEKQKLKAAEIIGVFLGWDDQQISNDIQIFEKEWRKYKLNQPK